MSTHAMLERRFWPIVFALAAVLVTLQVLTSRQENLTWDEGVELTSGYLYLATGEYRADLEQPPLARVWAALPLLLLRPDVTGDALKPQNAMDADRAAADWFLYHNRRPAERMFLPSRLMMIASCLALVLVLAAWCRARFGVVAALLTVVFFMFDPNIIAHGRYIKNDVPAALLSFLAVIAWERFLATRRRASLLLAGVALGLAIGTKFSTFTLVPVFVILYAIHHTVNHAQRFSLRSFLAAFATVGAVAAVALMLVYAPYAGDLIPRVHPAQEGRLSLPAAVGDRGTAAQVFAWLGHKLGWRAHPFLIGFAHFSEHAVNGHREYLWGEHSETGWWYYFPAAFAVKTPVATLAALAILLAALAWLRRHWRLSENRWAWLVLAVPILIQSAASIVASVNIGLRHLLPLYPFLFAALGAGLAAIRAKLGVPILALLVVGLAAESLAVYPYYTAFFNVLAGGPIQGPRYLVDSNIDWGQDLKRLGEYLGARGIKDTCVCYFGSAPMWYYHVNGPTAPSVAELKQGAPLKCEAVAISVTPLYGVYIPEDTYAWLRTVTPAARIGWSIYVWDVADPQFQEALAKVRSGVP